MNEDDTATVVNNLSSKTKSLKEVAKQLGVSENKDRSPDIALKIAVMTMGSIEVQV